ncbi:tripartite tricarboxylate transporter family receptor domain protein [Bordetella bronchiseptica MBORD635]|uniref:hypothetical protein n=1 Tax=Bordetella bronchiseptica TaxID=518 RepID=UPI000461D431|nr:hypothetical protein [Bordetella bronchiseptica]KDC80443.1 tripartite tricarboxylate transporter family receptor domain protein [Bordetella bronchiseptica MBORD635]
MLARLRAGIAQSLKAPAVLEAWRSQGAEVPPAMEPAALQDYVRAENQRWQKAVRELGIKIG